MPAYRPATVASPAQSAAQDVIVDRDLEEIGLGELDERHQREERDRGPHEPVVRPRHRPQPRGQPPVEGAAEDLVGAVGLVDGLRHARSPPRAAASATAARRGRPGPAARRGSPPPRRGPRRARRSRSAPWAARSRCVISRMVGAAARKPGQDLQLLAGVDVGEDVVEDRDRRGADEGPGQRQALALAARQRQSRARPPPCPTREGRPRSRRRSRPRPRPARRRPRRSPPGRG